ncbi:unnamed protein product [Meganyctiphanes norvegica]|uniref:Enoyl reductase (ER) domain-containing protein n=1 Tax=Meganyctiphanes norvegica TaxID=48144 RepID=A0AAV2PRY8_MEGNR
MASSIFRPLLNCRRHLPGLLNNAVNLNISLNQKQSLIRYSSTYKAALLHEYGQNLILEDMTRNILKSNEVRVAVHSCGVNASDRLMVENLYDHPVKRPFVPGFEVCGEVLEVGSDVKTVVTGTRVIGLNKVALGGFAEECVLDENDVFMVDHAVCFDAGAALADCYSTALLALNRRAQIKEGDTVLITAAAGGLGLAAVDLASSVYRAKVIGVCGTEGKADLVRQKGAWAALKYNEKHVLQKVKEVTDGKGVDVVFDAVGGDVFNTALDCVAHEGKVVVAGFASRVVPHIETSRLLPKAISIMGLSLTRYHESDFAVYRQAVEDVIELHEMKLINPHICARFKLDETDKAFDFIKERRSMGKVVLEMD